jgi:hypothetical protein
MWCGRSFVRGSGHAMKKFAPYLVGFVRGFSLYSIKLAPPSLRCLNIQRKSFRYHVEELIAPPKIHESPPLLRSPV